MKITKSQAEKIIHGLEKAIEYYKSSTDPRVNTNKESLAFCRKEVLTWHAMISMLKEKMK
jgi:hypothetical protein